MDQILTSGGLMRVLAYGKKDGSAATFPLTQRNKEFILKPNNEIETHRNTSICFSD